MIDIILPQLKDDPKLDSENREKFHKIKKVLDEINNRWSTIKTELNIIVENAAKAEAKYQKFSSDQESDQRSLNWNSHITKVEKDALTTYI